MHKVQCEGCSNEVRVALYFYDKRIITHEESMLNEVKYYEASVKAAAICPICGCNITKHFKKTISNKCIVDLALGEELYDYYSRV
jgi:hypothetical protein